MRHVIIVKFSWDLAIDTPVFKHGSKLIETENKQQKRSYSKSNITLFCNKEKGE